MIKSNIKENTLTGWINIVLHHTNSHDKTETALSTKTRWNPIGTRKWYFKGQKGIVFK